MNRTENRNAKNCAQSTEHWEGEKGRKNILYDAASDGEGQQLRHKK